VIDVLAPSAIVLAGYLALVHRARAWPVLRSACFAAGLLVVAVAVSIGDESLPLHMAAHGVLVAVGAPLLVLGRPVTLMLRGLPRPSARELARLLRALWLRVALWPPLAWTVFVAIQLGFHVTPLFRLSLEDETLHAAEHLLFLASALWLWTVCLAVEPLPRRWPPLPRAALLMAAMMFSDVGSVKLMLDGDTAAGAAMVVSMMPLGLGAVAVFWTALLREERGARRREVVHAAS
jgi:cytochrome c oxidase assembly factor CtaG